MMDERTRAQKLAATIRWVADNTPPPSLLPEDLRAAADLLEQQEKELVTANRALEANEHVVEVEAKRIKGQYKIQLATTVAITSPRLYEAKIEVDDRVQFADPRWMEHVARRAIEACTHNWISELQQRAYAMVRDAVAKLPAEPSYG